jgi:Zn finger protein HypA/HybF involved in hydrogenase expression
MDEQKDVTVEEESFNAMAQTNDWYCKQCQEPITYEWKQSYYLTGYCPTCAQMISRNE